MIAYLEPTANTRFFSIPHLTPAVKRRGKPITGSSKSPHEIKFVGVESEIMPHDLCQKKKKKNAKGSWCTKVECTFEGAICGSAAHVDGCGCGHAVVIMVISISKQARSGVSCHIIRTCSS